MTGGFGGAGLLLLLGFGPEFFGGGGERGGTLGGVGEVAGGVEFAADVFEGGLGGGASGGFLGGAGFAEGLRGGGSGCAGGFGVALRQLAGGLGGVRGRLRGLGLGGGVEGFGGGERGQFGGEIGLGGVRVFCCGVPGGGVLVAGELLKLAGRSLGARGRLEFLRIFEGILAGRGGFAGASLDDDFTDEFFDGGDESERLALGLGGGFVGGGGDPGGSGFHERHTLAEVVHDEGGHGLGNRVVAGFGGFLGEGFLVGGDEGVFLAPGGQRVVDGGVGEEEVLLEELELGDLEVAEKVGQRSEVGAAGGLHAGDILAGRTDLDELQGRGDDRRGPGGGALAAQVVGDDVELLRLDFV